MIVTIYLQALQRGRISMFDLQEVDPVIGSSDEASWADTEDIAPALEFFGHDGVSNGILIHKSFSPVFCR